MPPRSEEPRRGTTGSRRGPSRADSSADPRPADSGGGISGARAYTPRGRSIGERRLGDARAGRAEPRRTPRGERSRSGDPFRPALQVLSGGQSGAARQGNPPRRTSVVRTVPRRAPSADPPRKL